MAFSSLVIRFKQTCFRFGDNGIRYRYLRHMTDDEKSLTQQSHRRFLFFLFWNIHKITLENFHGDIRIAIFFSISGFFLSICFLPFRILSTFRKRSSGWNISMIPSQLSHYISRLNLVSGIEILKKMKQMTCELTFDLPIETYNLRNICVGRNEDAYGRFPNGKWCF